jgi:hypothetical protein
MSSQSVSRASAIRLAIGTSAVAVVTVAGAAGYQADLSKGSASTARPVVAGQVPFEAVRPAPSAQPTASTAPVATPTATRVHRPTTSLRRRTATARATSTARPRSTAKPDCARAAMAAGRFDPTCQAYQGYLDPGGPTRGPTSGEIQTAYGCRQGYIPAAQCSGKR